MKLTFLVGSKTFFLITITYNIVNDSFGHRVLCMSSFCLLVGGSMPAGSVVTHSDSKLQIGDNTWGPF